MKKIVGIVAALVMGASVFGAAKRPELEPVNIEYYTQEEGSVKITVMPQVELMGIVCRLAEVPGFSGYYTGDNSYLEQVSSFFGKYKDSKIVKTVKSFSDKGITSAGFISLAYHIKPDFSGTTYALDPRPYTLLNDWDKVKGKEIYAFVTALHDFAVESKFDKFFVLNRGQVISDVNYLNENCKEAKVSEWINQFFGYEIPVTVNYSRVTVCLDCYDFAKDVNGNDQAFITSFPGDYIDEFVKSYILFYTQKYASDNWPQLKEHYTEYNKVYLKRIQGDEYKEENVNVSDYDLALLMCGYIIVDYMDYAFEEKAPGIKEELKNSLYKELNDDNLFKVFDLLEEYKANRDKYPTFKDFYSRMNDFINALPLE